MPQPTNKIRAEYEERTNEIKVHFEGNQQEAASLILKHLVPLVSQLGKMGYDKSKFSFRIGK